MGASCSSAAAPPQLHEAVPARRANFFRSEAWRREERKRKNKLIAKGLYVASDSDEIGMSDTFIVRSVGQAPTRSWRSWSAWAFSVCVCALPFGAYVGLFSTLGYGVELHALLIAHPLSIDRVGFGIVSILAVAWFAQVSQRMQILAAPLSLLFLAGLLCITAAYQRSNPGWPIALLVIVFPVWCLAGKKVAEATIVSSGHLEAFFLFSVVRSALSIIGVTMVLGWLAVYGTSLFTKGAGPTEISRLARELQCEEEKCTLAYVMLVSPLLGALVCWMYALLAYSLADARTPVDRILARTLAVLTALAWVAFQIAGASLHFTEIVTTAALAGVVGTFVGLLVYSSMILDDIMEGKPLGRDQEAVQLTLENFKLGRTVTHQANTLFKKLGASYGDWVLATALISPAPLLLLAYLGLDVLRSTLCGARTEPRAVTVLKELIPSNWSSVLPKAVTLATILFTVNVGVKLGMILLLSWLIGVLKGLPLGYVFGAYIGCGSILFTIPAVPGSTTFIAGGIIVTSAARDQIGYFYGILLATAASFVLKLIAVVLQQEVIGKYLGRSPAVRQLVGVNSVQVRAIKRILSAPGLSLPKILVLVGGPDWPTSVLAGILGCDLRSCLVGSLPVIFFIWPPCTMGALTLPSPPMDGDQQKLVLLVAAGMGLVPLLGAMWAIDKTMQMHGEELAKEAPDQDVVALEQQQSRAASLEKLATGWWRHIEAPMVRFAEAGEGKALVEYEVAGGLPPLPWVPSLLLAVAWLSAWGVVGLLILLDDLCYVDFEITDSIADKLGGNVLNAVYPLGWLAFLLQALALVLLSLFNRWGRGEADRIATKLRRTKEVEKAHSNRSKGRFLGNRQSRISAEQDAPAFLAPAAQQKVGAPDGVSSAAVSSAAVLPAV